MAVCPNRVYRVTEVTRISIRYFENKNNKKTIVARNVSMVSDCFFPSVFIYYFFFCHFKPETCVLAPDGKFRPTRVEIPLSNSGVCRARLHAIACTVRPAAAYYVWLPKAGGSLRRYQSNEWRRNGKVKNKQIHAQTICEYRIERCVRRTKHLSKQTEPFVRASPGPTRKLTFEISFPPTPPEM